MRFTFTPLSEADARFICAWRYDAPYAVYNMDNSGDAALAELLDRRSPYFAVRNGHGKLVGFFAFGSAAEVGNLPAEPALFFGDRRLSVGLGLRPDLTGQGRGLGLEFVNAGLEFARERFRPSAFRLFVLNFNQRAIHVYERAGFVHTGNVVVRSGHEERTFWEMTRDV